MKTKITLQNENGCLMDSDKSSLGSSSSAPSAKPSDSYIAKEFTNSSFTGAGFSDTKGHLSFIPVQVVGNPEVKTTVLCQFSYEGTWSGTVGGFGQNNHTVILNDIAPKDSYVELKGVSISCSLDDQSFAVYACPTDTTKSNNLQFTTVDTDADSPTKARTFKVVISGQALIENVDFGLGTLFPQ